MNRKLTANFASSHEAHKIQEQANARKFDPQKLGENIKNRRIALGIKAKDLAKNLFVDPSIISRIETGNIKNTDTRRIQCIADYLECSVDYLRGDVTQPLSVLAHVNHEEKFELYKHRLEDRRKTLGFSMEVLSAFSEVPEKTIQLLETKNIPINHTTASKLATALQCSIEYLRGKVNDPNLALSAPDPNGKISLQILPYTFDHMQIQTNSVMLFINEKKGFLDNLIYIKDNFNDEDFRDLENFIQEKMNKKQDK